MSDPQAPAKKPFNWAKFQQHLGYTDEHMAEFKADERRRRAAEAIPALSSPPWWRATVVPPVSRRATPSR
jgi:hypothetical protein